MYIYIIYIIYAYNRNHCFERLQKIIVPFTVIDDCADDED